MTVLTTRDLSVSFGSVRALSDVSITVEEGQIVGLIGPNGAGKTTFIDAVSGVVACQGSVEFNGAVLGGMPAHLRAQRGLTRTFQAGELFDDLSVEENLLVSATRPRWWTVFADIAWPRRRDLARDRVHRVLESNGLSPVAAAFPQELSLGRQKRVSIARAVATNPKLILLDEPAAGLNTEESGELGRHLRQLAAQGIGMLLVDHDMSLVLDVCDYIYVIDFGEVIAAGPPAEIRTDPGVIGAYLGTGPGADAGSVANSEAAGHDH